MMVTRSNLAYDRRNKVAKTWTALTPNNFAALFEYLLEIIITVTKNHIYKGKTNWSQTFM